MPNQMQGDFFDEVYEQETRKQVSEVYAITTSIRDAYKRHFPKAEGLTVLEYGCGTGSYGFYLAEQGAKVVGIDISETGIKIATEQAEKAGLVKNLSFQLMDAENLDFDDESFDLVTGTGILHHLDQRRAMSEIKRVLRPGGKAIFIEPMGLNPALRLFRKLTPQLRVEDEYPLKRHDLVAIGSGFEHAEYHFYYLTALAAIPFRRMPFFPGLVQFLDGIDRLLFKLIPPIRYWAWQVLIVLEHPHKS